MAAVALGIASMCLLAAAIIARRANASPAPLFPMSGRRLVVLLLGGVPVCAVLVAVASTHTGSERIAAFIGLALIVSAIVFLTVWRRGPFASTGSQG